MVVQWIALQGGSFALPAGVVGTLAASARASRMLLSQLVSSTPAADIVISAEDGCVRVDHVASHSPAAQGGLQVGDFIASVDGRPAIAVLFETFGHGLLQRGEHVYQCYRALPQSATVRAWQLKTTDGFPLGIDVEPTIASVKHKLAQKKDGAGDLLFTLWKHGEWRSLVFNAGAVTGLTCCPTCCPAVCNDRTCGPCCAAPCYLYCPENCAFSLAQHDAKESCGELSSPALVMQGAALVELGWPVAGTVCSLAH